jgi:sugar (pentulose or hexulose) kinase
MKAAGIVILFPLISVIIVSLYVHGGASRTAALVLLIATVFGVLAGLIRKRSRQNG